MTKRYVTTRDIVIPAGTELAPPPTKSSRWGSDYEAVVGHGRDHTSFWTMNLDEALAIGVVVEE